MPFVEEHLLQYGEGYVSISSYVELQLLSNFSRYDSDICFMILCQMKLKKTGDWRREILGDMTVMNAEEVPEFDFLNDFC